MIKKQTMVKVLRFLLTLLGAGLGAGVAVLVLTFLTPAHPGLKNNLWMAAAIYTGAGLAGALVMFLLSSLLVSRAMRFLSSMESRMEKMPLQQVMCTVAGLTAGLMIAALITQLVLSAGASLITLSFSALTYAMLGYLGMRVGFKCFRDGKLFARLRRRGVLPEESEAIEMDEPTEPLPRKYLDTSVIIDGRILDVVKTGFLEGEIVVPQFVLAELRHIADSGDSLRRARGRRGLDVLQKMQKDAHVVVDETDYPDFAEVDVKLLKLCREKGGTVVTNDYNLNKVAGVTGIRVLNLNDLANAIKPMLLAGEELTVQVVREGKEPGQGVAYLDDGTMIVIENGRCHVGETIPVVVTTVLQTSAGRMIFTKAAETRNVS